MGKAYSKAAKRRAKKELPGLAEVPKRRTDGRRREYQEGATDPRKAALTKRCRVFGIEPTKANREALSGQQAGAQLGMVMLKECKKGEIPRLWSIWQDFCAAERNYRGRILGVSASPKGAAITMVPEKIETDPSHKVDTRDSDTRDQDAVNTYMRWRGHLGYLPNRQASLLLAAEREEGPDIWSEGPTSHGKATLNALKALADVVDQRG